jgi:RNA polymerase sigma-70 factor (ECF subfamily)
MSEQKITPEQVFTEYASRIVRIANRIVKNKDDAEDVAQNVLLQVCKSLDTFRGECKFTTWLHRITVNAALAYRRKQAIQQGYLDKEPVENYLTNGDHKTVNRLQEPAQEALNHETKVYLEKAIAALPSKYKEVYVRADLQEEPNGTIARDLNLSLATVKNRLHRARKMLKNRLEPYLAVA